VPDPSAAVYADTFALVKLLVLETETKAAVAAFAGWPTVVASKITTIELHRALARARVDERAGVADDRTVLELLTALTFVPLTDDVRALAATARPTELRTLDALHLASALTLGPDLQALATYDHRLADAAAAAGLTVLAPGTP
jgi:uncharacterized protein